MGRPLYSRSFIPAVRSESPPPSQNPPYEKWTYWNPFDPDSDEFFENDPVYEAFIDLPISHPPTIIAVRPDSPASTASTPSDIGSPVAPHPDYSVRALPDPDINSEYWPLQPQQRHINTPSPDVLEPDLPSYYPSVTYVPPVPRILTSSTRPRSATITVLPRRRSSYTQENPFDGLPRTSNITPITIPARTTVTHATPLPNTSAQSVTPRILTWTTPSPPANPPASPLTNLNARMSLTRITPTLIRVRDVAI